MLRFLLILLTFLSGSFKTFSQTFNGVGGLPFPPSGTTGVTQSQNPVSGVGVIGGCTYIDNVTINLDHTWVGDIALLLIAPNGTFIELSSGNGGPANNYTNTVFTDSAPLNIIDGSPPYTGNFQPEGRQNSTLTNPYPNTSPPGTFTFANTFNGVNADGNWILYLNDYVAGDFGTLNSWSITFVSGGTGFTVDIGPDLIVCAGDDITLSANNTASTPTYLWSNGSANPTLEINNIGATSTFTVTVTDASGCTASDQVLITVNPTPQAFQMSLGACEISGTGQTIYNLTVLNPSVSPPPNSGTVTYYFDINATSPIPNPTNFLSGPTTVYATVTNGTCTSDPVPILLIMTTSDPSQYGMNIVEDQICGGLFTVLFTLPNPGTVYIIEYKLTCGTNSTITSITTAANPIFFSTLVDCTLEIFKITPQSTLCNVVFIPPLVDNIVVNSAPNITTNPILQCPGDVIDLSDFVTAESGSTVTYHTGNPPTASNQIPSQITVPSVSTTYYVLADNGCPTVAPITVNVSPGGPTFNTNISLCESSPTIDLSGYISPVGLSGIWSGDGVSGNNFNPANLSGQITLTFTPDNICYDLGTLIINLNPDQNINLSTATICASGSILDLSTLTDPLVPNGIWSGPGTAGGFFDPALASGIVTLTFTPSNICITPSTTTITVLPNPPLQVQSNIIVCQGSIIDLNDYVTNPSNFTLNFYNNLPAIPVNEILNSIFTLSTSSTFYVKITDPDGCFTIAPLTINTSPGGIPNFGTAVLCQSQSSFDLNTLNDPNAGSGIWSGPGVTGNTIDLTAVVGIVNLLFTPDNTCFSVSDTDIEVLIPQNPVLGTEELCSTSGNYILNNIADPSFLTGVWSGTGVSGNIFNPLNLTGIYTLTFDSDQFCVNNASTTISVIPSVTPNLGSLTVCETTPFVDLTTLSDPIYMSGFWSGPGVIGSIFETAGLSGINLISFTSDELCVFPAITTINVNIQQTPQLQTIAICETSDPIDLSFYVDPAFPIGIWSGPGVLNGYFDPTGLLGVNQLIYIATDNCILPSFTSVTINSAPTVTDIITVCDQNTQTFSVQFTISGGDNTSYTVNNIPSSSIYISNELPSQSNYSFTVTDNNQCSDIIVQGNKNCDCLTDAGTMNFSSAPLKACINQTVTAFFNNNATLGDNDRLIFILHDNPGPFKGNILSISKTPSFTYPPNGTLNTVYYISAAVGDSINLDSINFNDSCLSVAAGIPVTFYEPNITLNNITDVCYNNCADLKFDISGEGPFRFISETYINNLFIKKDTINTLNPNYTTTLCPSVLNSVSGIAEYRIIEFSDRNCLGKINNDTLTFTIFPARVNNINQPLCKGEELFVNGNLYNESKPSGTEIIPATVTGQCDSIILISLQILEPSTTLISSQLCINQSITVNNKIYDVNNASGTEIISGGSFVGCDSIIQVSLIFTNEIITEVSPVLCLGENIIVNGKIYNENNPSGSEIIPSNDGTKCDSVINVALKFKPQAINNINTELCDNETFIINGKTYSKSNPFGTEILINAATNGCDSIVNLDLRFKEPIVNNVNLALCDEESYIVNGNTYSKSRPYGQEIILDGAVNGCDSIVNIDLQFSPKIFGTIVDTLCVGQSIEINGQVYDKDKMNGSFTLLNASSKGCDSTVLVNIFFYKEVIDTVILTIKRGESIVYNGTTFDENITQKLTTKPELTLNGCVQYTLVRIEIEQEFISTKLDIVSESCPQKNDGQITILEIKGCKNYSISLNNVPVSFTTFPIMITDLSPGSYILKITGDLGCTYEENIKVDASGSVDFIVKTSSFDVKKGESIIMDPMISPSPFTIQWIPSDFLSCDDCPSPSLLSPEQSIQYQIYLTNANGCTYIQAINVNVFEPKTDIVFPNIFSPDGDGSNDIWTVLFTNSQRITNLFIYDRWGNQVFEQSPADDQNFVSWDGRMKNREVLPGVYIFVAKISGQDGKIDYRSGDMTVIR